MKGTGEPKHAGHGGNACDIPSTQVLIELGGPKEHAVHVGAARNVPTANGLVERVLVVKDAREIRDMSDAPRVYRKAIRLGDCAIGGLRIGRVVLHGLAQIAILVKASSGGSSIWKQAESCEE